MNQDHAGRIVETDVLDEVLSGYDLIAARDALVRGRCSICGASPRTGKAFLDPDYGDTAVYALCPHCGNVDQI